ncbi:hypothetical protein L2E82_37398 [Cichorium intybus]|uniref:Uncharacterized protein n=1 Tax=Cichorium intybus TaxID=13427 RepID=A0ACB9AEU3_CICIN|nr:hypothetical protein L2E82_37398 [Cichorium intybus]
MNCSFLFFFKISDSPNSTAPSLDSLFSNSKSTIIISEILGDVGLELLKSFAKVDCSYNLSPEDLCSNRQHYCEAAKGRLKVLGRAGLVIALLSAMARNVVQVQPP